MSVRHVIVTGPYSLDLDAFYGITLRHVSVGGGRDEWQPECREPHLWRCVPIGGCGFEWADIELDAPPDLPPGVYDVTCERGEWGGSLYVYLTDEPVLDPEQFLSVPEGDIASISIKH